MNYANIPLSIVLKPELHKHVCIWIRFHQKRRPIFYNVYRNGKLNYKLLSNKTGISDTCIRKHINALFILGWCKRSGKHLVFKGLYRFDSPIITIKTFALRKQQLLELRYCVIRHNLDLQNRQRSNKEAIVKKAATEFGKLTTKEIKQLSKLNENPVQPLTISNKGYGKLINRSIHTGKLIQKKLRTHAYIKTKKRFRIVKDNCTLLEYQNVFLMEGKYSLKQHRYFYKGNKVIEQCSNEVVNYKKEPPAIVVSNIAKN